MPRFSARSQPGCHAAVWKSPSIPTMNRFTKTPELLAYTCKTRAKAGTTPLFPHRQRLCYLARVRLTLALIYVLPEMTLPAWSSDCSQQLRAGGFARDGAVSGQGVLFREIIGYLQRTRQAASGVSIRGKAGRHSSLVSGTRQFQHRLYLHRRHSRTCGVGRYSRALTRKPSVSSASLRSSDKFVLGF